MHIREIEEKDIENVSKLIQNTLRNVNLSIGTEFAIKEQIEEYNVNGLKDMVNNRNFYVLVDDENIIGVGAYKDDKIHSVFIRHDKIKNGYGKKLMKFLENKIECNDINLVSGVGSVKFYKKN